MIREFVRVLLVEAGITGFEPNYWVTVSDRTRHRIDNAFPKQGLALEYLGDYHREPDEWRKGITRRLKLKADGWTVMEIAAKDVNAGLAALVRQRLEVLGG